MTDRPLETQKRLFGNTVLLSGGDGVAQLANFVFVVALARTFGRDLLGVYAFAMAVGALLSVFVSLGTHRLVLRKLSREPERTTEAVGALLAFQAGMAVALVAAVHLAAQWLDASPLMVRAVTLLAGFHVLLRLTQLFVLGYTAREKMGPAAVVAAAERITVLLLGGLAMAWGAGAELTLASMPAAALLILIVTGTYAARRFGRPRLRFQRAEIADYLRQASPFFHVIVLAALYLRLGIIYLTVLGGEAETGLFTSAEKLVAAAGMVQIMFSAALFPVVSRLWNGQREQFADLMQRAGRLILFLTLPIATLLALFAQDIVRILYGDTFSDAAAVLAAVAWVLVLRGIWQLLATAGQAADRPRLLVAGRGLGLAVLTLASLVLIPPYGAMGLVAAMLAAEIASVALLHVLLQRAGVPVMGFGSALRVVPACLLAAGLAYLTADLALWLRLGAVAGGGAAALWLFGAIRSHDLTYLRAIADSRSGRR